MKKRFISLLLVICVASTFLTLAVTGYTAIFAGKLFGKHKLCPTVSPKKTVEGAIGGIVVGVILVVGIGYAAGALFGQSVSLLPLVLIGVFGGPVTILGDLTFSLIKRNYEIKDFGNLIPGHGGILDRFDSVIFLAPFVYYLTAFLPIFG